MLIVTKRLLCTVSDIIKFFWLAGYNVMAASSLVDVAGNLYLRILKEEP